MYLVSKHSDKLTLQCGCLPCCHWHRQWFDGPRHQDAGWGAEKPTLLATWTSSCSVDWCYLHHASPHLQHSQKSYDTHIAEERWRVCVGLICVLRSRYWSTREFPCAMMRQWLCIHGRTRRHFTGSSTCDLKAMRGSTIAARDQKNVHLIGKLQQGKALLQVLLVSYSSC